MLFILEERFLMFFIDQGSSQPIEDRGTVRCSLKQLSTYLLCPEKAQGHSLNKPPVLQYGGGIMCYLISDVHITNNTAFCKCVSPYNLRLMTKTFDFTTC